MRIITDDNMMPEDWQDARTFCLKTIKEVYGIGYRRDWHDDLDSMLNSKNVYTAGQKGGFVIIRSTAGELIACGGLRSLTSKPTLVELFKHRYPTPETVGGLWRAYVAAKDRHKGLGTIIKYLRIQQAKQLGYSTLYLHASQKNPLSITFGQKFGFSIFQIDADGTVHMDRSLSLSLAIA